MHAKETMVGRRMAMIRTANDKPRQNWYRRHQETENFRRSATLSLEPTIMAKFKTKKRNGRTPQIPGLRPRSVKETQNPLPIPLRRYEINNGNHESAIFGARSPGSTRLNAHFLPTPKARAPYSTKNHRGHSRRLPTRNPISTEPVRPDQTTVVSQKT
jgi:hypothetical protein